MDNPHHRGDEQHKSDSVLVSVKSRGAGKGEVKREWERRPDLEGIRS